MNVVCSVLTFIFTQSQEHEKNERKNANYNALFCYYYFYREGNLAKDVGIYVWMCMAMKNIVPSIKRIYLCGLHSFSFLFCATVVSAHVVFTWTTVSHAHNNRKTHSHCCFWWYCCSSSQMIAFGIIFFLWLINIGRTWEWWTKTPKLQASESRNFVRRR